MSKVIFAAAMGMPACAGATDTPWGPITAGFGEKGPNQEGAVGQVAEKGTAKTIIAAAGQKNNEAATVTSSGLTTIEGTPGFTAIGGKDAWTTAMEKGREGPQVANYIGVDPGRGSETAIILNSAECSGLGTHHWRYPNLAPGDGNGCREYYYCDSTKCTCNHHGDECVCRADEFWQKGSDSSNSYCKPYVQCQSESCTDCHYYADKCTTNKCVVGKFWWDSSSENYNCKPYVQCQSEFCTECKPNADECKSEDKCVKDPGISWDGSNCKSLRSTSPTSHPPYKTTTGKPSLGTRIWTTVTALVSILDMYVCFRVDVAKKNTCKIPLCGKKNFVVKRDTCNLNPSSDNFGVVFMRVLGWGGCVSQVAGTLWNSIVDSKADCDFPIFFGGFFSMVANAVSFIFLGVCTERQSSEELTPSSLLQRARPTSNVTSALGSKTPDIPAKRAEPAHPILKPNNGLTSKSRADQVQTALQPQQQTMSQFHTWSPLAFAGLLPLLAMLAFFVLWRALGGRGQGKGQEEEEDDITTNENLMLEETAEWKEKM